MNNLGNLIGELCKVILPIPEESYKGNSDSEIAVCTLSSLELLKKIANSNLLSNISIVGRLLSENRGIDEIIRHVNQNKKIKIIIICGKEVWGHKAGHSLFKLHKNGFDDNRRIIGSSSPDPILTVSKSQVDYFRNNVNLVDMINETSINKIEKMITQ
jgi:tetrahydromethanopterin S-methyltransferase subunit A